MRRENVRNAECELVMSMHHKIDETCHKNFLFIDNGCDDVILSFNLRLIL